MLNVVTSQRHLNWNHEPVNCRAIKITISWLLRPTRRGDPSDSSSGNDNMSSGDHNLAFADFERALQQDPNVARAYNNRGLILILRGKMENVEKALVRP